MIEYYRPNYQQRATSLVVGCKLGERDFYKGFVCDEHRISARVEKFALPQRATAIV
jgi:hypothetical protein